MKFNKETFSNATHLEGIRFKHRGEAFVFKKDNDPIMNPGWISNMDRHIANVSEITQDGLKWYTFFPLNGKEIKGKILFTDMKEV